jgi:hypothetical protein
MFYMEQLILSIIMGIFYALYIVLFITVIKNDNEKDFIENNKDIENEKTI